MKHPLLYFHYARLAMSFALGMALTFFAILANADINSQTLRYAVEYAKQNAGELEVVIQRNEDQRQLKINAISHLSLLAKMFLTAQTSTTFFQIDGDQYRLLEGADYLKKDGFLI